MSAAPNEAPQRIETDGPEVLTDHLVFLDLTDCATWGVMPGTALCGYVFTTETDAGPAELVTRRAPGLRLVPESDGDDRAGGDLPPQLTSQDRAPLANTGGALLGSSP